MSDHVTFHTATGGLEEAKQALATAEAHLASIGKKGLLERQATHDKKVSDAQAAVDAARARVTSLSGGQTTGHQATGSAAGSTHATSTGSTYATGSNASNASVEAAAERIRKLKAENAPQIEVRAAVEAHALEQANALKAAGAPQAEVKAAVLNYIALTEDPLVLTPVEVAKKKVRMLKANEAPQEEVKAAVEAYTALLASESKTGSTGHASATTSTGHAASTSGHSTSRQTDSTGSQSSSVEAAAEKVRALKAAKAPQAEVKAAVEAYIALTEGGHKSESKGGAVVSSQTPVEAAAEKVRQLKAARAPQAEVKAAVEAYVALTGASHGESHSGSHASTGSHASSTSHSSTHSSTHTTGTGQASSNLEHKASGDLEAAAERVRSLKASKAPQAEVKAAVEAYVIEEAKDKVNRLKASRAPQAEVKAAVEAYVALTEGHSSRTTGSADHTASGTHTHGTHHTGEHTSGHTGTHHTGDHTTGAHHTGHDSTTGAHQTGHAAQSTDASEDTPAVRMHLGQ